MLRRVQLNLSYVVKGNDQDMINQAKLALYEDIMGAVKYDELEGWIEDVPAPEATEDQIPEFLTYEEEDDDYEDDDQ